MKKIISVLILIGICLGLTGCGETISGVTKDVKRVGKGVKMIFMRDEYKQ